MTRASLGLAALCLGGCATIEPAVFSEKHPANPAALEAGDPKQPTDLRAYALPQPRHPLSAQHRASSDAGSAHEHAAQEHAKHGAIAVPPPGEAGETDGYTCPMHPEVSSKTDGRCPICEMNLVPREVASTSKKAPSDE